eukprot:12539427-Alexandrium_andersonii.AAC.1
MAWLWYFGRRQGCLQLASDTVQVQSSQGGAGIALADTPAMNFRTAFAATGGDAEPAAEASPMHLICFTKS